MYSDNLLTLFGAYSVAKAQYEMEVFALIEATKRAEEGFGMKAMGFSHPYDYATFCGLQKLAGVVQNKWASLCDIQRQIMDCFCVQIRQIEPPKGVDGDSERGH
jgi:hypothetical protein